jgi:hypothetical protein
MEVFNMTYTPNPIKTIEIRLPDFIYELSELLAKNTHENWALQRIRDGWTFGHKRDDELKQSPCLVPYEDLPESEKEYDRITATETLKTILALGFRIESSE